MKILSAPSKMPCPSFSLPAFTTCPGAVPAMQAAKAEGTVSVCGSCYARKGFYRMPNVSGSQADRLAWRDASMLDGSFVSSIVAEISASGADYFRIHDSGDFDSIAYTLAWRDIAAALPEVKFWAPTRSYFIPEMLPALRELAALPNVTVRPSAASFGGDVPEVQGLHCGTSADAEFYTCPAPSQDNACGDCRKCWDEKSTPVTYKKH